MTAYGLQPVLVTTKAVITLIVASVTLRLTKKIANHAPAAVLFILRIRLKGIQGSQSFLALLAGQLKFGLLNQPAVNREVIRVPQQYSLRLSAVAARTAGLLYVLIQPNRRRVMNDQTDIRNVDSQTHSLPP